MAVSQEAIIAIVGIVVNLPTFCLVFWHIWNRRRRRSEANRISANRIYSQPLLLQPRRLADNTLFAFSMPYTISMVNVQPIELEP
ncbi:hypothetical protein NXS19_011846 [Fusarium pseudograminearum]|nr:hypothetical protein NXS19_011846 [Fusarium pseudograminearum]